MDCMVFNSLPNDKILDWSKLKAFADNKINAAKQQAFFVGWIDNIVGKDEKTGYQDFLLFQHCYQKAPFLGSLKSHDCVGKSFEAVFNIISVIMRACAAPIPAFLEFF